MVGVSKCNEFSFVVHLKCEKFKIGFELDDVFCQEEDSFDGF